MPASPCHGLPPLAGPCHACLFPVEHAAEEVLVLDLRGISPVTDYFVICTGTSNRQMRAVADEIVRAGQSIDHAVWHVAGQEAADWIVLDFVDVVVHIFSKTHRKYYDLELIWGGAPRVRWRRRASAAERGKVER